MPTRNLLTFLSATHCALAVFVVFTLLVVGLVALTSGVPMYNDGFAVVPCANVSAATELPTGATPQSGAGRAVLWCRGPHVGAAMAAALVVFCVYAAVVRWSFARYRRAYSHGVNWMRARVLDPVAGPIVAFAVLHYSGAAPRGWDVAIVCIAATVVPLQAYTHRKDVAASGVYPLTVEDDEWVATTAARWCRQLLCNTHVIVDAGVVAMYAILLLRAAGNVPPGPYADSLDGSMTALPVVLVLCKAAGVCVRVVAGHLFVGNAELAGVVLAFVEVYVPLWVAVFAPQVHNRR